jgi:hypothetical protein
MASTRRKSAAIALAVVGVAGLSLASAATLSINANSLGAGTDLVASCDTDGVDVGFGTAWDAVGNDGYDATAVDVTSIDAACNGQDIAVTLTAAGVVVDEVTGTVAAGAFTSAITAYDAELIDGVSIVIHG